MDVFSALQTSVSGLRAQAYALENISGNIANSQTTGFKRVDTSFVDMIPDLPANQTVAGTVNAYSQLTNTIQGSVVSTGVPTNMAVSGDGYFAVQAKLGESDGAAQFGGTNLFTRRGDFTLDKSGYLVNGAGYYLTGSSIDPVTGLASSGNANVIKLSSTSLPAVATKTITYAANLPNSPTTPSGTELLTASTTAGTSDPRILTGAGTAQVDGSDASRFISQSVAAGSFTAYDSTGAPADVQMRWAKVATATTGDTWNLFYQTSSTATGTTAAWKNVGSAFTFNTAGKLTSPASGSITISGLAVDKTTVGDVALNFGTTGLTNYASSGGAVSTTTLQQDGYAAGTLNSFAVTSDGKVTGSYSNGRTIPLAQVAVVQFNADNALKRENNGVYSQTLESGAPISGLNGATIIGGNVEQSNTDIAAEFSKIIVTQQAYSANTRVMSTAQQMISDILNVIR
jgi:flagellar hook protein FlgE